MNYSFYNDKVSGAYMHHYSPEFLVAVDILDQSVKDFNKPRKLYVIWQLREIFPEYKNRKRLWDLLTYKEGKEIVMRHLWQWFNSPSTEMFSFLWCLNILGLQKKIVFNKLDVRKIKKLKK